MTLIEISALPQPATVHIPLVLDRVVLALASAMERDPAGVWATWRTIEPGCYCVRGHAPSTQPQESHDPLVRISAGAGESDAVVSRSLEAVARTLAGALGLEPANIFVVYEEARAGRVFTGGAVRN